MGILVSQKLWFTKDGAWYRHPKFSKFQFDWERIKNLAEGEVFLASESEADDDTEGAAEGAAEGDAEKGKKKDIPSKAAGKQKVVGKTRKTFSIRTGGKFEIREGEQRLGDSESESDSEGDYPHHLGETSRNSLESSLLGIIDRKLDDLKKSLGSSILQFLDSQKKPETQPIDPPTESNPNVAEAETSPKSPDPVSSQSPKEPPIPPQDQASEELDKQPADGMPVTSEAEIPAPAAAPLDSTSEAFETLHKVAEDILNLNPPQSPVQQPQPEPPSEQPQPEPPVEQPQSEPPVEQPQPEPSVQPPPPESSVPPRQTFKQRRKQAARKTVVTRKTKKI